MANNEPMTVVRRAAIKARCDAATPGPWVDETRDFEGIDGYGSETHPTVEANGKTICILCEREIDDENDEDDAEFIAHARQDIPDLLAEVERWQRVARYLAKKLTHDDGSENSGFPSGKWQGALLEEVERLRADVARSRAREEWLARELAAQGNVYGYEPFCPMPGDHKCEWRYGSDLCRAMVKARAECWRKAADMATRENQGKSWEVQENLFDINNRFPDIQKSKD